MTPTEIVQFALSDAMNEEHIKNLVTDDFTYVSLNYVNEDLKKVLPWAGTHKGPKGFSETFKGVYEYWNRDEFRPQASFDDGENVAIFGTFTLRSKTLNKARTSPFAIFAKVKNGKISYFQYMEDTVATIDTFKTGGKWIFKTTPNGKEVEI